MFIPKFHCEFSPQKIPRCELPCIFCGGLPCICKAIQQQRQLSLPWIYLSRKLNTWIRSFWTLLWSSVTNIQSTSVTQQSNSGGGWRDGLNPTVFTTNSEPSEPVLMRSTRIINSTFQSEDRRHNSKSPGDHSLTPTRQRGSWHDSKMQPESTIIIDYAKSNIASLSQQCTPVM